MDMKMVRDGPITVGQLAMLPLSGSVFAGPPMSNQHQLSGPPVDESAKSPQSVTNTQLLKRMVRFLLPVRGIAALACMMIFIWAGIDVVFTRLFGNVVTAVKK